MKDYKLVNSKESQAKALRLGYRWSSDNNITEKDTAFFIYTDSGGFITYGNTLGYFTSDSSTEITQADFLELPEPLKVGDWVRCELKNWIRIVKIERMNDSYIFVDTHGIAYELDICTKLTHEQIKVLGLTHE